MLKVTKFPRLPVGNLLYVTVCHRLNNAESSQGFQVIGRQSVIVFNCYALKFHCSYPVEKRFCMCQLCANLCNNFHLFSVILSFISLVFHWLQGSVGYL